ncbi:hypothetical protein, partial [Klebsiella pneumoniae]|uniref:hypothetical protein n=1 Tax=Klebsiella pneumoniae TaxID=573 RepID=UPI001EF82018
EALVEAVRVAAIETGVFPLGGIRVRTHRAVHAAIADGEPAHTGCVAFGMDRLAVALFATHGGTIAEWPASVR